MTTEQDFVDAVQPMEQTIIDKVNTMGMDGLSDKFNINVGESRGGSGDIAALIAAMNSGGGANAATMAALSGNGGLGGNGGIGTIALLALLSGRGGLFGNNGNCLGDGCVTPATLATSLGTVTETLNNSTLLQTLGEIKAAIPFAEGQVQLALAGAQADINSNINSASQSSTTGIAATNQNIANSTSSILLGQASVRDAVTTAASAQALATLNSQYVVSTAVRDDGDKTRALIVSQNDANLQRMLTVAEQQLAEQRAVGRSRDIEVNVSQTVSQNQMQLQAQAQQQQQFQILANLSATVANLANDIQVVRQGQTIFNSGTMAASGTQAAANTKVN